MTENQTDRRTGAERRANARPEYDRRAFLRRMADLDDQIREFLDRSRRSVQQIIYEAPGLSRPDAREFCEDLFETAEGVHIIV